MPGSCARSPVANGSYVSLPSFSLPPFLSKNKCKSLKKQKKERKEEKRNTYAPSVSWTHSHHCLLPEGMTGFQKFYLWDFSIYFLKNVPTTALAGVAQCIEHQPTNQKVPSLIASQGMSPVPCWRHATCNPLMFLTHWCFSTSFSASFPSSLKIKSFKKCANYKIKCDLNVIKITSLTIYINKMSVTESHKNGKLFHQISMFEMIWQNVSYVGYIKTL